MKWGNIWFRDQKFINCSTAKRKFIIWAFLWHFFSECLSARLFSFCRNQEMAITWVLVELDFVCIKNFELLHCVKSVRIRTFPDPYFPAFEEILCISPYSIQMRENTEQKNSEYRHFSCSITFFLFHFIQANKSIRELLDVVYCDCDIRNYV